MLGKLLLPPSLTSELPCCSIYSFVHPTTATTCGKGKFSFRNRTHTHKNVTQEISYGCPTSRNWRLHSIGSSQSYVLIEEEEKKAWDDCRQLISAINFSHEEADAMLAKAFGWANSPYWGEERSKEIPKNDSVNGILNYLRSLGLSDDDLHKLIKKFPEILGCSIDDELKPNIATLEREWAIKGKTLRSLLLRNPKVLGYNVDCKGDCIAKCTRCWVRF